MDSDLRNTVHIDALMKTGDGRDIPVTTIRDSAPVQAEPVELEPTKDEWLTKRLAYWQRQLRLLDWNVTAEYSTFNELQGKSATIWWGIESKAARIRVVPREEWPQPSVIYGTWDVELFLVHELLHLYYIQWRTAEDNEDPEYVAKEQAIDMIADALIRLDRGQPR